MVSSEQKVREEITQLFLMGYLPEIKKEVSRFIEESYSKQNLIVEISAICGRSVAIELGQLKIAEPTNKLIDVLVKMYVKAKENQEA